MLDEIGREGARTMLAAALEAEVDAYLAELSSERDEHGHALVTRNGHARPRKVQTIAGAVEIRAPRVNDRRVDEESARDRDAGYQVVGICVRELRGADDAEASGISISNRHLGPPDELVAAVEAMRADAAAIVGSPDFVDTDLQQTAWRLERRNVDLFVVPNVMEMAGPTVQFTAITGLPLLRIGEPRISGWARFLKPVYERALAAILLCILTPLLCAVALAVLIDSGAPVFYRQRRLGLAGREFRMIKFCSMVRNADVLLNDREALNDHDGAFFKLRVDPRVTRVGRFIRKHSLDELPQLLNVPRGEMVLVGPRPCLPEESAAFDEAAPLRFLARPGITGLWQVSERSDIPWDEAVRLYLYYYVENWSPLLNLLILWRTLRVVVSGQHGY